MNPTHIEIATYSEIYKLEDNGGINYIFSKPQVKRVNKINESPTLFGSELVTLLKLQDDCNNNIVVINKFRVKFGIFIIQRKILLQQNVFILFLFYT